MQAIVLLGAPGAGKGTMAEGLKEQGWLHVSTGDILREAIRNGTETGMQAQGFMERGELVPDETVLALIRERMQSALDEARFMFDGFPRTLAQAQGLDALLAENRAVFIGAFLLEAPQSLLLKRLTGRRTCRACGAVYHVLFSPPVTEGVCDQCGGTDLYQREDDTEATILNRLAIFEKQTAPLIDFYQHRSRLWRINADGDRARILADLCAALKEAGQ